MKKSITFLVTLVICTGFIFGSPAQAEMRAFIGLKASTFGLGIEVGKSLIYEQLNLRAGFNTGTMATTGELVDQDIEYSAGLNLSSWSALIDYYPWEAGFHLTGGVVGNNNAVEATIKSTKDYSIGGRTYNKEDQGQLDATIDWPRIAPYLGFGWGNPTRDGLRVNFELGAMYQNSPQVAMSGVGMIAPTANQAPKVEEDLAGAKVWFLVSLGLTYGF